MTSAKPFCTATARNNIFLTLKSNEMKLYILYQTDIWRTKISRVFFGIFDSRPKALDCAKYNGLYGPNTKVVIEEVTLNIFEEI
jgi:hypothetical protein